MESQITTSWHYNELEEAQVLFLALAARTFNGQQQNPMKTNAALEDGDSDVEASVDHDVYLSDHESNYLGGPPLPNPKIARLKDKFLDNFAELLARKKEASFVSCAALVEGSDSATIFVSRNERFNDTDDRFFKSVSEWVAEVGSGQCISTLLFCGLI